MTKDNLGRLRLRRDELKREIKLMRRTYADVRDLEKQLRVIEKRIENLNLRKRSEND